MMTRDRQVKIGAILSYAGVLFGIITGLIYNPWMIETIGNGDYGLYTLAMSLINTFLVDFGLSMASQRYISKYLAEKDQKSVDNIVGLIFNLYIVITAILAVAFFALYFFISNIYVQLTPDELVKFRVLYIMAAIYSITSFPFVTLNGILSSYERFVPLKVCDLLYKVISISLTTLALIIGYGVNILVIVNLIASLIVTVLRIIIIKKTIPLHINFHFRDTQKTKELFGFSIWTSISTVTMSLLLSLGPSILGIVSGSYEIAVFGYAVSIEGYVYMFVNAINGFFMPKLSRISLESDAEESREDVLNLMISVGRFILLLFGLITIGFLTLGKEFIDMLVGADYKSSYYCVLLICAYGIVAYPQQIANTYTIVKNKVKKRAIISLITIPVYTVFAFTLGKPMGAVGISIAVCIALFLQTTLMNVMYYTDLKINIFCFFKECHIKMLPGFALFFVLSELISRIPEHGWMAFLIKAFLIVLIYLLLVWFVFLNKNEKQTLLQRGKRHL